MTTKPKQQALATTEPTSAPTVPALTTPVSATTAAAVPPATPMTTVIDFASIPLVSAPPSLTVPSPPAGYVAVPGVDLQGYRPIASEVASVPDAILEIQAFPNWALVFGMTAPPASQVAQRLQVAAQWSALQAASERWYSYVRSQAGLAWKAGLEVMEDLKAPFQLAATTAPAMPNAFPALARLLSAQQTVGQRGAATRKRNAAAAAAAAAAAPATPSTTATTAHLGVVATTTGTAATQAPTAAVAAPPAAPVVNVTG
jgi:hypothetical protein